MSQVGPDLTENILRFYLMSKSGEMLARPSVHGLRRRMRIPGLFWGFWAWILAYFGASGPGFWPILGLLGLDLCHFGPIFGLLGLNFGHFGPILRVLGLNLGHLCLDFGHIGLFIQ